MSSEKEENFGSPHLAALKKKKPISSIRYNELHAHLEVWDLVSIGVGSVIGAGIFIITGVAAAKYAGPALTISFIVSSVACFFTGMSFAELASTLPALGSTYLYSSVWLGEGYSWLVGVCLAMENLFAASSVSVGWSAAFMQLLEDAFSITLPRAISTPLFIVDEHNEFMLDAPFSMNLISVMLICGLGTILSFGVKESAQMTVVAVALKLSVLVALVIYGIYWMFANWELFHENHTPFVPVNTGKIGKFGFSGILRGSSAIFFSYIGFDSITAMAAECKNPTKDIPRAIIYTLVICTSLYIAVTYVLTGMVNYTLLNVASPVTFALQHVKAPYFFLVLIDIGAVAGLLSVSAVGLLAQSRVLTAMSHDKLLPAFFGEIDSKFKVPRLNTFFCMFLGSLLAGLLPLDILAELVSFGTLTAFFIVNVCVIIKRRDTPDLHSPFKVPHMSFPYIGIASCLLQLVSLPTATIRNFLVLVAASYVFYFFYRLNHSATEIEQEWKEMHEQKMNEFVLPAQHVVDELEKEQLELAEKEKEKEERGEGEKEGEGETGDESSFATAIPDDNNNNNNADNNQS